jgi:hypothetical protein
MISAAAKIGSKSAASAEIAVNKEECYHATAFW